MLRRFPMIAILTTLAFGQGSAFARTQEANIIPLHSLGVTTITDAPAKPRGNLTVADGGNVYLTSTAGGANGVGAVSRMTPAGDLTTIYSFTRDGTGGNNPFSGVIQASDGNLYGTAYVGGTGNGGSIYRLTLAGVATHIHSFDNSKKEPFFPYGGLVQASDGNLYGTTLRGGSNDAGTIFRIALDGTFTLLHEFNGGQGENPEGTLIQAADGNLYGTTMQGGNGGRGTIFRISLAGAFTSVFSFPSLSAFSTAGIAINATGANPRAALLQAADGNFYGTAYQGGPNGYGTVYRMTPSGTVTVVHAFTGPNFGGAFPLSSVTQDAGGNLYGTTERGGAINSGSAWRIDSAGQFSMLHGFTGSVVDGSTPYASILPLNGELFALSFADNTAGYGSIFKLDVGTGGTPPVDVSVSPSTIVIGASTTLTWSSPTATECSSGGAWNDLPGTQGSKVITPEFPGIYNFILNCTDGAGVVRWGYTSLRVDSLPQETVDGGGGGGALPVSLLLLMGGGLLRKLRRERGQQIV